MNKKMARSQRAKLPLAVMMTSTTAVIGTEMYGLMPK